MTAFPRVWERVDDDTMRMRVPSGWLVRVDVCQHSSVLHASIPQRTALCFVPDEGHLWELGEQDANERTNATH